MDRPFLFIVTGEPGAGKTTFAKALAEEICFPFVCRDHIKEGLVHTWEKSADGIPSNANLIATTLFFQTITQMIENGCSVLAEAAFQHPVWSKFLTPLMEKADIRICICAPEQREIAQRRYLQRGLDDPRRTRFHNDPGLETARNGLVPALAAYEPPRLAVPTFHVDTTSEYHPPLSRLAAQLFKT